MARSKNFNIRGWKILGQVLLSYKEQLVTLSVLGVFTALGDAAVPYLVGYFFDVLSGDVSGFLTGVSLAQNALFVLAIWVVVQLVSNTTGWIADRKNGELGNLMLAESMEGSMNRVLDLPQKFHKTNKTGEVWNKIVRAAGDVVQISQHVIIRLAPEFLAILIGISIAATISPLLAGFLIIGMAVYVLTLVKILPPVVKLQKKGQEAWNEAYGHAYEVLSSYQTVKANTAEAAERKKLNRLFVVKAARLWGNIEKIWTNVNFYQRIIVITTQLAIFVTSIVMVENGVITIGGLIALNSYAAMVFGPFVVIGQNWQTIQNGLIALERLDAIKSTRGEFDTEDSKQSPERITGAVAFENVVFSYGNMKDAVLKDISFEVAPGQVVALVGESGVGKSTTIDLLSGYYFANRGKVSVDGIDLKKISLRTLREHMAVVPQEVVLFDDTIFENIRYGRKNATKEEVIEAARKAHADIFINSFPKKYKQVVGERGVKLSVGQKQRIAIARAILRNPAILILDEPTSALDIKTETFISESLEELMRGRTTFIIAHRLSTVRSADLILVFDAGRIVERGTHNELIARGGRYKELHDLHIGLS